MDFHFFSKTVVHVQITDQDVFAAMLFFFAVESVAKIL
jgi:hypothetical protein